MRRNAFTLVELLVSISLFGLIAIFLFGTIDQLRKQQTFFQKKETILSRKNMILSLLRSDLDRAQSVNVSATTSRNFDTVSITGSNHSLYGIDRPYLVWIILKIDNSLIRLESPSPISLPIHSEKRYLVHSDLIAKQCEIFRVYTSAKHRLSYLKFEHQSPLIVETFK